MPTARHAYISAAPCPSCLPYGLGKAPIQFFSISRTWVCATVFRPVRDRRYIPNVYAMPGAVRNFSRGIAARYGIACDDVRRPITHNSGQIGSACELRGSEPRNAETFASASRTKEIARRAKDERATDGLKIETHFARDKFYC